MLVTIVNMAEPLNHEHLRSANFNIVLLLLYRGHQVKLYSHDTQCLILTSYFESVNVVVPQQHFS